MFGIHNLHLLIIHGETMPRNAMTVHYSGMTLEAQKRIEDGVKDILERFFNHEPFQDKDIIVASGRIASKSYTAK